MFGRGYSLRKSQKILHSFYQLLQKKAKTLTENQYKQYELKLKNLEEAIFAKDRAKAQELAKQVETEFKPLAKKGFLGGFVELFIAIAVALVVATVVRQMWFELYEIPTGSMRPSFRENDHLAVTKTAFGLNVPLQTDHFYFDPDLVKRGGVVIFSGDGIALQDTDTTFFGIFPYKKRYIKRLIGKPGDTLYFYGGKIWGIDSQGDPIAELLDDPWMKKIEHIPFIQFDREWTQPTARQVQFKHFNKPVGRFVFNSFSGLRGEVFDGKKWVKETPFDKSSNHAFYKMYGIGNFAMARLVTKDQVPDSDLPKAALYLELKHSPNLSLQESFDNHLSTFTSYIPLNQKHLDAISKAMYTARFVVEKGRARRWGGSLSISVPMPGVGQGVYEFYNGVAYKVGLKGWLEELDQSHPLYSKSKELIQTLYNDGIDFFKQSFVFPNRYAYFRDGDLYLMGAPILEKQDPVLVDFVAAEEAKAQNAMTYIPFVDQGSPVKDGQWNKELIETFGLKVPDRQYLVLGDNHAMSADSRIFGFVPEANIQGAPEWILWPPGSRWGFPPQTLYPFMTAPRAIVWMIVGSIAACWFFYTKIKYSKRLL